MTINFSDLKYLDYPFRAEPFCNISAKQSVSTETLDSVYKAEPFVTKSIETVVAIPANIVISTEILGLYNLSGCIPKSPLIINLNNTYQSLSLFITEPTANILLTPSANSSSNIIANPISNINLSPIVTSAELAKLFTLVLSPANITIIPSASPEEPRLLYSRNANLYLTSTVKNIFNTKIKRQIPAPANITISTKKSNSSIGVGTHPASIQITTSCRNLSPIDQTVPSNPLDISLSIQATISQRVDILSAANIVTSSTCVGSIHTSIPITTLSISSLCQSVKLYNRRAGNEIISADMLYTLDYVFQAEPFNEVSAIPAEIDFPFRAEPFVYVHNARYTNTIHPTQIHPAFQVYERYPYPGYQYVDGVKYRKQTI